MCVCVGVLSCVRVTYSSYETGFGKSLKNAQTETNKKEFPLKETNSFDFVLFSNLEATKNFLILFYSFEWELLLEKS